MKNGYDDPKITRISDARRKKDAPAAKGSSARSLGDWVIGGLLVAMAAGMVVYGGHAAWQWLAAVSR